MKNFLGHAPPSANARSKRGGGQIFLPLHEDKSKMRSRFSRLIVSPPVTIESSIAAQAAALVNAGLRRLAADYKSETKEYLFDELRAFLGSRG